MLNSRVGAAAVILSAACIVGAAQAQTEWYTYRHDSARTGAQPFASDLSDPDKVKALQVQRKFPMDGDVQHPERGFYASPIIVNNKVFIGSINGYFYALDGETLALNWQFPKVGDRPLLGSCDIDGPSQGGTQSVGRYGIPSSATYAQINGQDAVIFGASDPDAEGGLGSAALFALDFSGNLIWKSDAVAHVTGCTYGSTSELHERIANSSPLVLGNNIYVGVADAGDSPIQNGKVIAVDLTTGHINSNFQYLSTAPGTRGGGVWNSPATDGTAVYFTTGNTRKWNGGEQKTEPNPNFGLSMIRVNKDTGFNKDTGKPDWNFQPVLFANDDDPDWAAGATVMNTSCGELIASVQKDGWSYALNPEFTVGSSGNNMRWQFPFTGLGPLFQNLGHGDSGYRRPGAAWNDVFIVKTGGEARSDGSDKVDKGYGMLHALNSCATNENDRVRWILKDIPNNSGGQDSLGAPTVTGGIVFIGTDQGHLIVIGDPSVAPAAGRLCSNLDYNTSASDCAKAGFNPNTPIPTVLANRAMPDAGDKSNNIAGRNEPALANGRVYIGTQNGHVYMLDGFAPPSISAIKPNSSPCGSATDVTITGLNFNDLLDVSLRDAGGVSHPVGFDPHYASVQVTAHIPNTLSSGPYGLIVHTAHGSSSPSGFFISPVVDNINPPGGPATGGTEATLSGRCFHRDMIVSFGGIQAATLAGEGCASDTQCIVFSPPATAAGPADVVANVGGARSAPVQFSYFGPDVTGISPSSGPITGGTPVEITGSGFPAYDGIHPLNAQVSFDGVQTMAECFVTDCDVATPAAMHAGAVPVTVTAFGVSSTSPNPFTYNQYPALTKFLLANPPGSGDASVYLDGNAPADDAVIQLTSSDPSAVSLQRTATVLAGSYWTSVPLTFLPTSRTETVTLTAAYQGSSVSATLSVSASPPISIALGANELGTGEQTTATVTLNPPAPPGGAAVTLSSSDPSAVPVPPNLPIPSGSFKGTFDVTNRRSGRPERVTITASYGGASASDSLVVPTPPGACQNCRTPEQCCVCNGGVWVGGRCE